MPSPSQSQFCKKHPIVTTPPTITMFVLLFSIIIFHYGIILCTEFSLSGLKMICFVKITLNQLEHKYISY